MDEEKMPPHVHTSIRPYLLTLLLGAFLAGPALAQERHALLIGGLGGSDEHRDKFQQYLLETRRALVERHGFSPTHVVVLAEPGVQEADFVSDVSTAENVSAHLERLASAAGEGDQVYIVLFGHGSYDGQHAHLNIPRQDLSDADFADLLAPIGAGRIVFINTASASASFAETLSAPGRVIITATRSPTQRNETAFPAFLVEALQSPAADLDKNGDLSMREVFEYAAMKTAQSFEATGHLATEDALLEDTGDGQAFRVEELGTSGEGSLAAVTYLRRGAETLAEGDAPAASAEQLREREALERTIAELRGRKARLSEDAYYAELEELFIRLARLNDQIETGQQNR